MLARSKDYLSINELKSIMLSFLLTSIILTSSHHASQIWSLSDTKYTDKVFKIQKNAVHIMTRAGFNAHTSTIFKSLGIQVHDQITLLNCLFAHDFQNGKLPKSFDNTFSKLSDVGSNVSTINSQTRMFIPSKC